VADQKIKSARDLEGKRLIYTSNAPCVYGNLRHSLALGGADLEKIEFVLASDLGIAKNRTRILEQVARGEAAASVDSPFDRRGEKLGMHKLGVPTVPVIHNATMCANVEWVRDNEETTTALLKSMIDAIHFFKTQPEKTREILERRYTPLMGLDGPDEVERLYDTWSGLLSPKPYLHPLAIFNVYNLDIANNPEVNFIGPFELWDTSLLRAIDDSDYIDELYGGGLEAANPPVNAAI
jgi:hypothetical protein